MQKKIKKIILISPGDNRVVMKKEYYSHSSLSLLQQLLLKIKILSGWRFQYLFENILTRKNKKHFAYESQSNYEKPLVYSCSGCSNTAQMANYIALQLDRNGTAEMSCIVGVGGNVKKLVRTASSGRKIITIDGCPLACSRACLGNHSINADGHFDLTQANKILKNIQQKVKELSRVA